MSEKSSNRGTAVVTGASAGIGRVYADRLAKRGYDLLLVARRQDRLEAAAAEVGNKYGVKVRTLAVDLGDAESLAHVVAELTCDTSITLLVNNAGVSTLAPTAATSQKQMASMIAVNVTALAALTLAVLPGFKERNAGTLINIGSVLSYATLPISTIYSGTKAFVSLFTRGVQDEVVGTNVRVQLVQPAATATDIWELSGVPLSNLDAATVMSVDNLVDAALAGLDRGEAVTLPSVEDSSLHDVYDQARTAVLGNAGNGKPATRYQSAT